MVSITSIGSYLPIYRLSCDEIAVMWTGRSNRGTKAVAGYDEDTVTMAVAAALDCMMRGGIEPDGLSLATTTAPYREKQSAAIVASAVDLPMETHTADYTGSLRAGSITLKSAIDAVNAGSLKDVVVTAADCRLGATKGNLEQVLGDGAAAVHQHSHLAAGFEGDGAERAREFLGDEPLGRQPAPGKPLELANLAGLQAVGVPEDPDRLASVVGGGLSEESWQPL